MSAAIYKNKLYMSLNCSYHLPIDIGVPAGYALHQMKMIVLQLGWDHVVVEGQLNGFIKPVYRDGWMRSRRATALWKLHVHSATQNTQLSIPNWVSLEYCRKSLQTIGIFWHVFSGVSKNLFFFFGDSWDTIILYETQFWDIGRARNFFQTCLY